MLILMVTTAVITIWITDRVLSARRIEKLLNGSVCWVTSTQQNSVVRDLNDHPEHFEAATFGKVVRSVLKLFKNAEAVNTFSHCVGSEESAASLTADALDTLDCGTIEEYLHLFYEQESLEVYIEYQDRNSPEHLAFREFLSSAISLRAKKEGMMEDRP